MVDYKCCLSFSWPSLNRSKMALKLDFGLGAVYFKFCLAYVFIECLIIFWWNKSLKYQHPNFSDCLHKSHTTQYLCGYCKSEYLWGYYEGTLLSQELWHMKWLQSTLKVPSRRYSSAAWYETYVASHEDLEVNLTCYKKISI